MAAGIGDRVCMLKLITEDLKMSAENQVEMPKYRSHKEVWALKIAAAQVNLDGSVTIAPADEGYAVFTTHTTFGERFKGDDNDPGYYVAYRDGYKSWSPSSEFEDGYTRIQV